MTEMKLFPDFERTFAGRANHDNSNYSFLNNSSWEASTYVRNKLINWASNFPLDKDFIKRFTSKNNQEHLGAFFEIVIFQWLKNQNLHIDFHQTASVESGKRPDFTVSKNQSQIFLAECTLSAMPDNDLGLKKLRDQITDVIESIPSPKYWINIDFEDCSSTSLSKRKLITFVQKVINEGQGPHESLMDKKKWTLNESGWRLTFSLFPKSIDSTRSLGMVANGPAKFIDSERPLRTALDRKRGRNYGVLSKPYVICINSSDIYQDEISIMQALFGQALTGSSLFIRGSQSDSFFLSNNKPQNTSVSAVLIVKDLVPWNLHVVKMSLWHNPWAKYPLNENALMVEQHSFTLKTEGEYERTVIAGKSLGEILEIDPSYMNKAIAE